MIECQVEQGNEPNIEVFQINECSIKRLGGFDRNTTKEGFIF